MNFFIDFGADTAVGQLYRSGKTRIDAPSKPPQVNIMFVMSEVSGANPGARNERRDGARKASPTSQGPIKSILSEGHMRDA